MDTIGERIKEVRLRNSLTQEEFSKSLGISRPHLSKIEAGKENASDSVLRLISELYDVDYKWICAKYDNISFSMNASDFKITHNPQRSKAVRVATDLLNNSKVKNNSKNYYIENLGCIFESLKNFYTRNDIENCNSQDIEIICAYIEKKMLCALEALKKDNLDD